MLALSLSSPAPLYLKRLSDSEIMFLIIIYTNSPSDTPPDHVARLWLFTSAGSRC